MPPKAKRVGRIRIPELLDRLARVQGGLPKVLAPHFPIDPAKPPTDWGIARQLRVLVLARRIDGDWHPAFKEPHTRAALERHVGNLVVGVIDRNPQLLIMFDTTRTGLSRIVVDSELTLPRGIGERSVSALRSRGSATTGGLLGDVAGRLIEVCAFRNRELHGELVDMGKYVVALAKARPGLLRTLARGVVPAGTFGPVRRVTKLYTETRDATGKVLSRAEFLDFVYTSPLRPPGAAAADPYYLMPILGDVKSPGQIRKAGPKFVDAAGRLRDCTHVNMLLEGQTEPIVIRRDRIIAIPREVQYAVITTRHEGKPMTYVRRYQPAEGGGCSGSVCSATTWRWPGSTRWPG